MSQNGYGADPFGVTRRVVEFVNANLNYGAMEGDFRVGPPPHPPPTANVAPLNDT